MKTEIVVIIDNTPDETLAGEWGLCLLVKYNGRNILVDAGSSELFLNNMKGLGERVEDVDYAVLSHAHYDHANGFPAFFRANSKAELYVQEAVSDDCYRKRIFTRKYIGIPKSMMNEYADRIEKVSGMFKIMEGAYLVSHTTENLSLLGKRERMFRKTADGWKTDDFSHEQSLVLDTEKGLLIINSCSHGGAANIINEVKNAFPEKKVYGYVGGFHLFNKTNKEIETFARKLEDVGLEYVCTGHCTKDRAFGILKRRLGDRLEQLHVGLKIEI